MCQKFSKFPLKDCSSGDIDLLVVGDIMSQPDCGALEDLTSFFSDVKDMFSSSGEQSSSHFALYSPLASQEFLFLENIITATQKVKLAEFTKCAELKNNPQPQESTILPIVEFIYSYFSKRIDVRENGSSVAVMVISGPNPQAVETIDMIQNRRHLQTNVKLFVIMVDFDEEISEVARIPDTFHVPTFSDLRRNQLIRMSVCGTCLPGWFVFGNEKSLNLISCYFLDIDGSNPRDWFSASSRCEVLGSNLTSIETKEELEFLEDKLFEELINKRDLYSNTSIFIGLRREWKTLAKRFRWLSGSPMILSHWTDQSPNGGRIEECAVWAYQTTGANLTCNYSADYNVSQYKTTHTNGWQDVGCGVRLSNVGLCEVVLMTSNSEGGISIEINPANLSSFRNVIGKGEFLEFQGKIVSVPAYAENSVFYSSLKDKFQLFNCEESEGKERLISYSYVCDHVQNCMNERDESICLYRRCDPNLEFECRSHQCVPKIARCDAYSDCIDNSDEEGCSICKQRRCCDGTCIPKNWFNDNEIDCSTCADNSLYLDENFGTDTDESCSFICNRTACVYPALLGDGVVDCSGPEGPLDETLGKLERVSSCYSQNGVVKWAPRCVYIRDRYGGILGCRDKSHLWNCHNFTCPEGYVKCPGSYCIPLHLILNGRRDCPLGEDEQELKNHTCAGNFACYNSQVCLHPDLVCDGSPQCPSGDDELNCQVTCSIGFLCISGTVSVKDYDKTVSLASLTFVDPQTRFLDLSGVDVSHAIIKQDVTHLKNLVTIRLSKCKITTADGLFSSGISNLQSVYNIDLSSNLLKKITKNSVFRYMSNLRILNLSHNEKLSVLEDKAFLAYYGDSLLERLDLHNTRITSLRSSVLRGLTNLKVLNLSLTSLTSLYHDSFPKDFKLQILDLRKNAIIGFDTSSFNGLWIQLHLFTDNFGLCCPQIRGKHIPDYTCHAPEDTISSCSHLVREVFQRVLLWLVGFVAVLGNSTVILCRLFLDKGVIKKAYGIFVTNLGISDLIMGLYLLMIACADLYYKDSYVLNGKIWKESAICQVAGFLSTLSSETSAFFILLVTLDRYLVMKFPFGQYNFSKRCTAMASTLSWLTGFLLALLPLLPIFSDWSVYSSNGMCLGLPLNADRRSGWRYSVAVFVVLNSIIFLFIVAGQFSIYRAMSENRAATSAVLNSSRRAQDIAVAKQLSLVVLSNFLCWFPIGVMGLLTLTGHDIGKNAYTWSAVLVLPINSALNPLLYTVPILQEKWKEFVTGHFQHRSKGNKCKNSNDRDQKTPQRSVSAKKR